jgi:arylsulfatase A-like enzyme
MGEEGIDVKRSGLAFALLLTGACVRPEPSVAPVRLVDAFPRATVEGTSAAESDSHLRTEWVFEEGGGSEWRAVRGVTELRVEGGAIRGVSSSDEPVLVAKRRGEIPESELLHAIEVRARVSAGTQMSIRFDRGEDLVLERAFAFPLGAATTPLLAGDELRTYVLRPIFAYRPADIGHVLLIPTNVAGSEFEIESVRLVFRGEHLRSIASGVGWHGVSEVYRESLVTRTPETVRFDVELPTQPAFEVAVATIEEGPVTFRVDVTPSASGTTTTFRSIVSGPDRWQPMWVDLAGLGEGRAEVALSLIAERPGVLGFWGAPAIRSRATLRDRPQGVILIIPDTLRADHLSLYGYERETAPTLERLGREGAWFSDAISQSTWTKVSVPSIQTSLYPTTHTVGDVPDGLPASATTIAEVYRRAGYATLALTTIPFVGRFSNLHQGYEVLHERGSLPRSGSSVPTASSEPRSHVYVRRLLSWLEEHRGTRFFALLHVADPHGPFRPTREYETAFAEPREMDHLDELIEKVLPHIRHPLDRRFRAPRREELEAAGIDPEDFVRHERNGYDGKIRGMDDALGSLIEGLERYGLGDRTLVAVVSDHGTEFLEHGAHSHGHSVYGELNRVPMLVWGPGRVPAGRRIGVTVQTIDLMPTLLELSGLPIPEGAQGRSLVPLLAEGAGGWNQPAITELPSRRDTRQTAEMTALISEGWKLIRTDDDRGTRYELYDHREDPLNLQNLSGERRDVVERLAEQVKRFRASSAAARLGDSAAPQEMDSADLERLRSLGYVQ